MIASILKASATSGAAGALAMFLLTVRDWGIPTAGVFSACTFIVAFAWSAALAYPLKIVKENFSPFTSYSIFCSAGVISSLLTVSIAFSISAMPSLLGAFYGCIGFISASAAWLYTNRSSAI